MKVVITGCHNKESREYCFQCIEQYLADKMNFGHIYTATVTRYVNPTRERPTGEVVTDYRVQVLFVKNKRGSTIKAQLLYEHERINSED